MAKIRQDGAVIIKELITAKTLDELKATDTFSHVPEAKRDAAYDRLWEKVKPIEGTQETTVGDVSLGEGEQLNTDLPPVATSKKKGANAAQ